jgi:hypothetical protein
LNDRTGLVRLDCFVYLGGFVHPSVQPIDCSGEIRDPRAILSPDYRNAGSRQCYAPDDTRDALP